MAGLQTLKYLKGMESWSARAAYLFHAVASRARAPEFALRVAGHRVNGIFRSPEGNVFDLRAGTLDAWVVHPSHEWQTHEWLDENIYPPGGVMLDVGGYCGSFGLRHISKFSKIYVFEPFPDNFEACQRNIYLSKASDRAEVSLEAASDSTGLANLSLSTADTHSLVGPMSNATVQVNTVSLDDFLQRKSIAYSDVRLLKADVEGAELLVLRGSTRLLQAGDPTLLLEANSVVQEQELTAYLAMFGYRKIARLDRRNCIFQKSRVAN